MSSPRRDRASRPRPASFARILAALLAALLALFVDENEARANPADAFGVGSRAAALGGAATALADDSSAVYYNPAGLARASELRIDIGYQAAAPTLSINGKDSGVDSTHGLVAGLVAPGHLFGKRFAFGALIDLPDDRLSRSRSLPYAQPRFALYDNRTQRVYLAAGFALEIVRGLYAGVGLAFMARTTGTVELSGLISATDPDGQSALATAVNVDLLAVRYPQAGLAWEVNRYLTIGVSYRHSFSLQLDQAFSIHGTVGAPGAKPVIDNGSFYARTVSTDLFQPWQLTVGGALRLTRSVQILYDLSYLRWSEFETPAASVTVSLDLGAVFNDRIHLPPVRAYPSPGFHDIVVPRIGVEWRALDRDRIALLVRGGYRYEPSPVPEQTGETNYADADKHAFSFGLGLLVRRLGRIVPKPLAIDAHVGLTAMPSRVNRKTDPTDPVGDFTASGYIVEGGVGTRWSF